MRPEEFFEQLRMCPDNWYIWKDISYPKGALRTRERKGYPSVDPIRAVYRFITENPEPAGLNSMFVAASIMKLDTSFILKIVELADGEPAINSKDREIRTKLWRATIEKS